MGMNRTAKGNVRWADPKAGTRRGQEYRTAGKATRVRPNGTIRQATGSTQRSNARKTRADELHRGRGWPYEIGRPTPNDKQHATRNKIRTSAKGSGGVIQQKGGRFE